MPEVTRLLTRVDTAPRSAAGFSASARHEAVLDDGRTIVLLNDRGWSASRLAPEGTVDDMKETARMVVGPDAPFGERSWTDMEAMHWASLIQTLRAHGIETDAEALRALPHEVELSDRVLACLDAAQTGQSPRQTAPPYPSTEE